MKNAIFLFIINIFLMITQNCYCQLEEVQIGKQIWMNKNLEVSKFKNGEQIFEAKNEEDIENAGANHQPAWCYYEFNSANGKKYGKLYNWYAVNDPRGLAPDGWKIPTDDEWGALINYLGGEEIAVNKLINEIGFNCKNNLNCFGGIHSMGRFKYINETVSWWSSTSESADSESAWKRTLSTISRDYQYKGDMISVRCLKK